MKFLMLVVADPSRDGTEEPPITIEEWVGETYGNGKATDGDRLRPPSDAKTVRRRNGKVTVTDGPFAETHEWIAGFDILDARTSTKRSSSHRGIRWRRRGSSTSDPPGRSTSTDPALPGRAVRVAPRRAAALSQ